MRVSGQAAFVLPSPAGASPAPSAGADGVAGTSSGRTSPRMTAIAPSSPMVTMHPAMARSSGEYSARASTAASMASMRSASRRSSSDSPVQYVSFCASSSSRAVRRSSSSRSASAGLAGAGCTRPKRAVALQSASSTGSAHFQ